MATSIDESLVALGLVSDPPGLQGIEDRVLAAINAQHGQEVGSRMTFALAAGAMLIGVFGAAVPYRSAIASPPPSFVGSAPLAPSSLLLGPGER